MNEYAIALDIGGTKAEAALVNSAGEVLASSRFRAATGRDSSSQELEAAIVSVLTSTVEELPENSKLIGVGIGSAGPIDIYQGLVSPFNLPAWQDYPIGELVKKVTGLPYTLRVDGLCITLAEYWVGAGKGVKNLMGMIVSTGVGGGLIIGDRLIAGPSGNAGHIGHLEVAREVGNPEAINPYILEAVASGPSSVWWANQQGWPGSTGEELAAAVKAGDEVAVAAIKRSGYTIGKAIASAAALLDLEMVTIGGGFSKVSPLLFESIREAVKSHHFGYVRALKVEETGLDSNGPLIGAAALIHLAHML